MSLQRNCSDIDEEQFSEWYKKKEDLNRNIKRVCNKYGEALRNIEVNQRMGGNQGLMYDAEHNLIFGQNAKVCITSLL